MKPQEFRDLLEKRILVIDGAIGTMIQDYGYDAKVYGGDEFQMLADMLVFSRPESVKTVHLKYFKAGADAVETNTLCSSPLRLQEFDFSNLDPDLFPVQEDGKDLRTLPVEDFAYRLNRQAAMIARRALEEHRKDPGYDNRRLLVLGSLGPSNWVLSSTRADLSRGNFEQIERNFHIQALGLIDGGVDVLLFETQQDILELKVAVLGAKRAMRERAIELPIMAQVTVDPYARMQIFHTDILAALTTIQDIGIDAFGINCGLGPDQMLPSVRKLSHCSRLPISVVPNAGLPHSEDGSTVYKLAPEELAEHLKSYVVDYGVNIVGGCCGTTPEHIRVLSQAMRSLEPTARKIDRTVCISGPQEAVRLDSSESLIRFGESLNVRGSKKVREAVENSTPINQEVLEEVVSEQVRDLGLEIIDVCMDSNVVDTPSALAEVIQAQTMDFPGAMSIDSFDVKALEKAIQVYPGRPVVNSISLEEFAPGVDKIDAVLNATKEHAPIYVALTTGPQGPAVTADEKVELAGQILEKASRHGVKGDQLLIDINAFPIGAEPEDGLNFAMESIRSIPRIKELDSALKTIIGVGNLTSGLGKKPYMRKVLTSIFLDEARKQGLDAAIVNSNHYVPVDSLPAADYRLGKSIVMEHDMDAYAELEEIALRKRGSTVKKKIGYEEFDPPSAVCAKIKDGFKERSAGALVIDDVSYEYQDRIVLQVAEIIRDTKPLDFVNNRLMPAMDELGAGFADGTVSLPHLLRAADVMKQVMEFLETYLKKISGGKGEAEIRTKGTVVLGTVYQDVHSIGKDLCKTLMENYGYSVIDLGVQVPVRKFVETAKENDAVAIGMSALLVQTSNYMVAVSALLKERGMDRIPLLVGGAPVNQRHAAFVALAGDDVETHIRDNVFYCRSGMDGVNYLNQLFDPNQKQKLLEDNKRKLIQAHQAGQRLLANKENLLKNLPKRKVSFEKNNSKFSAFAPIQKLEYSMRDFLPFLNVKLLFSLNWKYGGKGSWEKKGIRREDLQEKLEDWVERVDKNGWIRPQAVHALFPCRGGQNSVTVLHPETKKEIGIFTFNDVIGSDKKDVFNVAQYFHPGQDDVIGLQLSTAGSEVDSAMQSLKNRDRESAWLLQGLSNRVAEDMAAISNKALEKMLLGDKTGSSTRYSPGYPAMTDITNNKRVAGLLNAVELLGIRLTDGCEFDPTGTTAAIVCFHPDAGYR